MKKKKVIKKVVRRAVRQPRIDRVEEIKGCVRDIIGATGSRKKVGVKIKRARNKLQYIKTAVNRKLEIVDAFLADILG